MSKFKLKLLLIITLALVVGLSIYLNLKSKVSSKAPLLKRSTCSLRSNKPLKRIVSKQLGFIEVTGLNRWELRVLGPDLKYDELMKFYLVDETNEWGKKIQSHHQLKRLYRQVNGDLEFLPTKDPSPFLSIVRPKPQHGYEYKIMITAGTYQRENFNDYKTFLDPASLTYTTPNILKKLNKKLHNKERSLYWEFQHPLDENKLNSFSACDAHNILEEDIYFLAQMYAKKFLGRSLAPEETYQFLSSSEAFNAIRALGYNRIKFLPVHDLISRDGTHFNDWRSRYAVSKNFYGVDPHLGTPDDFRAMVNKAAQEGIGLISDYVLLHYLRPKGKKDSLRLWPEKPTKPLFGQIPTPWDTYFFDFTQEKVKLFVLDGFFHFHQAFGFVGTRLDAISGDSEQSLIYTPGGEKFYVSLMNKINEYWPDFYLTSEVFFEDNSFLTLCDGSYRICGNDTINNYHFYDWLVESLKARPGEINLEALQNLKSTYSLNYLINHDEVANVRTPGTGQYLKSFFDYHHVQDSSKRTPFFYALSMMLGSDSLSMLNLIYESSGNYNQDFLLPLEKASPRDIFISINKLYDLPEMKPEFLSNRSISFKNRLLTITRHDQKHSLKGVFNFSNSTLRIYPSSNASQFISNQAQIESLAPFEFFIQR